MTGLAGLASLGLITTEAGAQEDDSKSREWKTDIDADGHRLLNLGELTMQANSTEITDFAGTNLSIDSSGVLNATDTRIDVSDDGEPVLSNIGTLDFGTGLAVTREGDKAVTVETTRAAEILPTSLIVDDFEAGTLEYYSDTTNISLVSDPVFHGDTTVRFQTDDGREALTISPFEMEQGFEYRAWFKSNAENHFFAFVFAYQDEHNYYAIKNDGFGYRIERRLDGVDSPVGGISAPEDTSFGTESRWLQIRLKWVVGGQMWADIFEHTYDFDAEDFIRAGVSVDPRRGESDIWRSGRFGFGKGSNVQFEGGADYVLDFVTKRPL